MVIEGGRRRRAGWRNRLREPGGALIFLLPVLVLFLVFRFIPTLGAVGMSFTNYNLGGEWQVVGGANYVHLLHDPLFLNSLRVTVVYSAIYVPLTVVMALATALLLHAVTFGRGLFRASLFLPYATSFILAGVIWLWMYQYDGLINGLLGKVGIAPIGFLSQASLVLPSLAVVSAWKGFGYSMLILIAGLNAVPEPCLEAASVDGANAWQRFWRIRLPLLRPVLFFVLVIETIGAFQVFDTIYVMTGGGPVRASYALVYALFDQGFQFFDFGYAATLGAVLAVLILVVALIQRMILDRGNQ
ncbi:MAG TPA: sugar ABC transporter permease [Candidatus Dormibacteraeota bacterium]|jgi:multiple sugar transport system permease protein|nr:sugar ABC transporter permease [Candidatus Dormibacteraeota bacterium]